MESSGRHTPEATPEARFLTAHRLLHHPSTLVGPRRSVLERVLGRRRHAPEPAPDSGRLRQKLDDLAPAAARRIMFAAFDAERVPPRTRRHPYHPEVLGDDDLINRAIHRALHEAVPRTLTRSSRQPGTWGEYAELAELVNASALRTLVDDEVSRLQKIAQDPAFNIACECGKREGCGCPSFIVEHNASGLRANCFTKTDGSWGIRSKSYEVASPSGKGDDGQLYVGLGIGRWLYTVAASHRPRARWRADAVIQPAALAVRRALHLEDPFTWDSGTGECDWCWERKLEWSDAARDDFSAHPVHVPRQFQLPQLHFFERQRTG